MAVDLVSSLICFILTIRPTRCSGECAEYAFVHSFFNIMLVSMCDTNVPCSELYMSKSQQVRDEQLQSSVLCGFLTVVGKSTHDLRIMFSESLSYNNDVLLQLLGVGFYQVTSECNSVTFWFGDVNRVCSDRT